jgi:hypothetical protein
VDNQTTGCKIEFEDDAEINVTPVVDMGGTITFTNASREVTVTSGNFQTEVGPRDWIKSNDVGHNVYYEVLQVKSEDTLELRTEYMGATWTGLRAKKKNVKYMDDRSIVTVDCIGKETNSAWVKTAADAVEDLLLESGITNIDTASFDEADQEAPFKLSLAIPLDPLGSRPTVRDVITLINKSVIGSLYNTSTFDLAYKILTPDKPEDIQEVKEDEVNSYSVRTRTDTYQTTIGQYKHFDADRYTGKDGFSTFEFSNDFNTNFAISERTETIDLYLFEESEAQNMVERYNLYKSLTQSVIELDGKLNLFLFDINDKVLLNLDRLYTRFGGFESEYKVAIISKVDRGGSNCSVECSDLGNLFNRAGVICANDAPDFSSATKTDKIIHGYITDDDLDVPDITSEEGWSCNLIV